MKRRIAAGELRAAEVVLSCPWQAQSMSISDLLMSQKRWGRTRCRRLLVSLAVPENKQVGTLTERQRSALAAVLDAGAPLRGEGPPAGRPRASCQPPERSPTGLRPSSSSGSSAASPGPSVASSTMWPSGSRRYTDLK